MTDENAGDTDETVDIDDETLKHTLQRVLQAEKGKLHLRNPLGVRQDIQSIIEEEVE